MRTPLSWLRDYVDITMAPHELAHRLTFAGLEVEALQYVGLALPAGASAARISGLAWERDKIVVAHITQVDAHPDAERLVLVRLYDGEREHTVLTGAPNLFAYKGSGPLPTALRVAYAREGAQLYDGHKPGWELTRLKRAKIRGFDSYSMVCSEKELGISEEHEGVILFDADAPPAGTPLADYIGDVVFEIAITPNMARNASMLGVAREIAALTGTSVRLPWRSVPTRAAAQPMPQVQIAAPALNPRFTALLVEDVRVAPAPYWMQLRLRLAGMRSISNIVDITNYVMLETGQPLHAFDYAVLRRRAGSRPAPLITTRLPAPGETIATLDGAQRKLDDFTVLVADSAGALSIGGVMGGGESEVSAATEHVLLEAASWNFTNIRRTVQAQQLHSSQAGYRFSRGVHPALAPLANLRAAALMQQLAGGSVSTELCDVYPQPVVAPVNRLPLAEVQRHLGMQIPAAEIVRILRALEFVVEDAGSTLVVTAPDHRLDIGTGAEGIADLVEEVARIYGYERMPETQISDTTPPQRANPALEHEERVRDLLAGLGMQEVITYRLTAPEREQRLLPPGVPVPAAHYVTLLNPVAAERVVLRRALLASVLEVAEANARFQQRLALFEIGPVFLPLAGAALPLEQRRLALVLWGPRAQSGWQAADAGAQDFFDLKGLVELLLESLRIEGVRFESAQHAALHPGRCAQVFGADPAVVLGTLGELHPQVSAAYSLAEHAALCADFDLEALLAATPARHATAPVPRFPAVVEDIALLVDEELSAARVQALIVQTGGAQLAQVQLFDVFRSAQLGAGRKSLAYRLSYQSGEKTLTDAEAAKLRNKIVRRLQQELGATLRDK